MTTIATDGKVMVSDSRLTSGEMICPWGTTKVFHLSSGIIGISGNYDMYEPVKDWIEGGGDHSNIPDIKHGEFHILWIRKKGQVYEAYNNSGGWMRVKPPYAIGSGRDYAMGALMAGCSPLEAVKSAIKLDCYSGGKTTVCEIGG